MKQQIIVVCSALLLIAGTAAHLAQVKNRQRLGEPGLRLISQKVFDETKTNLIGTNAVALPMKVLGFESEPLDVTTIEANMLPPDTTYGRRFYKSPDGKAFNTTISVVMMGTDRTSIHKPEICLDGQGWTIEKSELLSTPIYRPHRYDLPIRKLTADLKGKNSSGQPVHLRAIYVYWFVSDRQLTAEHRERVWLMAKDLVLTGVLPRWSYVTYLSVCFPGQEEAAFEQMKEFIAASVPEFQLVSGPKQAGDGNSVQTAQNE